MIRLRYEEKLRQNKTLVLDALGQLADYLFYRFLRCRDFYCSSQHEQCFFIILGSLKKVSR